MLMAKQDYEDEPTEENKLSYQVVRIEYRALFNTPFEYRALLNKLLTLLPYMHLLRLYIMRTNV